MSGTDHGTDPATDSGSGAALLLLAAALIAILWANSPWQGAYERLWDVELGVGSLRLDLRSWVNEGLMTLFFLVVGMEIKRELLEGELRDRRAAALPVIAAVGGMVVPALVYVAVVSGPGSHGWAIPMATDIAFALGVLTLAARHAPPSLRAFLLTLAVVDDIGAILVIALVYSDGLAWWWVGGAIATVLAIIASRRRRWAPVLLPVLGVALWLCLFESGIHPTIAGVALGLLIPATPPPGSRAGPTPLARLERRLLPWTTFAVVPLFALANAGVSLSADALHRAATSPVTLGVVLGLVVGKTAGIAGASALAVRLRIGRLPAGAAWSHLVGTAAVGGIGFTVSLFVTELAFDRESLVAEAKVGILAASLLAGALGLLLLRRAPARSGSDGPAQ